MWGSIGKGVVWWAAIGTPMHLTDTFIRPQYMRSDDDMRGFSDEGEDNGARRRPLESVQRELRYD